MPPNYQLHIKFICSSALQFKWWIFYFYICFGVYFAHQREKINVNELSVILGIDCKIHALYYPIFLHCYVMHFQIWLNHSNKYFPAKSRMIKRKENYVIFKKRYLSLIPLFPINSEKFPYLNMMSTLCLLKFSKKKMWYSTTIVGVLSFLFFSCVCIVWRSTIRVEDTLCDIFSSISLLISTHIKVIAIV